MPKLTVTIILISLFTVPAIAAATEYRRLPVAKYEAKIQAGWIGQMVGVGWGAPTEFRFLETIIPEDRVPEWKPRLVNQFGQDDLYVEMTFLQTLEVYGIDASIRQAGIDFAESKEEEKGKSAVPAELSDAYTDAEYGKIEKTFEHGGQEREYILYKPEKLPANAPLLFVLHGRGQTNQGFYEGGFNDLADKNGFAVAYPQSTYAYFGGKDQNDPKAFKLFEWNAHNDPTRVDDVDFLSKLARSLQSEHALNPDRTFVAGFSKGGYMSYTLACQASETFKGVAIVAALMNNKVYENCSPPPNPMPVLHIHGTEDSACPIGGNINKRTGEKIPPDVAAIIDLWVKRNNCTTTDILEISDTTTAYYHRGGIDGNEVHYYEISGGGHLWPGEVQKKEIQKKQGYVDNSGINATEIIWEFFSKY